MEIPIPDDWDGESFCRWAICWPDSSKWRAILHGLVESPTRGRFWDFDTGNFEQVREQFLPAYEYNYQFEEVIMACGDTSLADAINNVAVAIASSGANCCSCGSTSVTCGTGGSGQVSQPGTTITGDVGSGATPPEGFETIGDYRLYKCAMATYIVDTYKADLTRLEAVADNLSWVANKLAIVCAGLLLSPLPGDELFALAALMVSTMAADIWADTLTLMQDAVTDAESDLVCALYQAADIDTAVSGFVSTLGSAIDSLGVLPYTYAAKQFIAPFTTADNLNRLFVADESLVLLEGNCSGCSGGADPGLQLLRGTGDLSCDGQQRTLTAEQHVNTNYYIQWDNPSDCVEYSLRVVSVTSQFPLVEVDVHNCDGTLVMGANATVNSLINGPHIAMGNRTDYPHLTSFAWTFPFSMDVVLDVV